MKYRWILFDADGTLFDYTTAEYASLQQTFQQAVGSFREEYAKRYARINDEVWMLFEKGEITPDRLRTLRFERLFGELDLNADPGKFSKKYLHHLSTHTELIPGAQTVLEQLKDRIQMMLITNGLSQVQRQRFKNSILPEYMHGMVVSEEVGEAKPAPAIFTEAFRRMGNPDRADVLMIGDSLSSDVQGAKNYGIDVCWFNPGEAENTKNLRPEYQISGLEELPGLIN